MNGEDSNRQILCNIARSSFEVVNRLLERDRLLARELRSDATSSRQVYREECITVEMAATLRERFPEHVEITLFTAREEKPTGADWYWRFERGDRAIHALVQAKRVQRTQFGQQDDAGHVDIDLDQLTQLVKRPTSASEDLPNLEAWLATFARFDANPPCDEHDLGKCPRHKHAGGCTDHGPSLWIAQASEILSLAAKRLPIQKIVEQSVRLDCILPCIDGPSTENGPARKKFALSVGLLPYQDCLDLILGNAALGAAFQGAMRIAV